MNTFIHTLGRLLLALGNKEQTDYLLIHSLTIYVISNKRRH